VPETAGACEYAATAANIITISTFFYIYLFDEDKAHQKLYLIRAYTPPVTTKLTFLGSGGGRFTTIYQLRATGGIYIESGAKMHIDPGPGALVQMHRHGMDPTKTDIIAISHAHTDHYTDGEILIEGITNGGTKKKGILIGSVSVVHGQDMFGPAISRYHQSLVDSVHALKPGDTVSYRKMNITATRSFHNDPTTVGFKISTPDGVISYMADTDYSEELVKEHEGARILILPVTRPLGAKIPYHLSTMEAAKLVKDIRPELAIMTHFGLKMLNENPEYQADWIWRETGIRTIAADDGMCIKMGKRIDIS
jgi:ribonuclease BN (tRNA processing enzyme)